MKDPIIEEIRKIRLQIDEEIKIDPKKFDDEIRSVQERYKDRLVNLPLKTIKPLAV